MTGDQEALTDRILLRDGLPNYQRLFSVRIDRTDSVHLRQDLPDPVDDQADLGAQRACHDQFHMGGAGIEAEIPDQAHVGQVGPGCWCG
jgi:bacterioferritin (cytochrome b1)